jgi:dipeptidyl aminopeptidase/acylaminoacyl peptidase
VDPGGSDPRRTVTAAPCGISERGARGGAYPKRYLAEADVADLDVVSGSGPVRERPIVTLMVSVARYGSWKSPLTADRLIEDVVALSFPAVAGDVVYWTEGRPSEGGRVALVRRRPDGVTEDVFGSDYWARTLVHEYGGVCFAVAGEMVYFSNFADQRLYRVRPGSEPEPITAEPPRAKSVRYAAPAVSRDGHHLYCVRERHGTPGEAKEVVNDIVVLAADGEAEPRVVAEGHDFFSFPTLSPDGKRIAWISWDHPQMPWDGTELWDAELGPDGLPVNPRLVAGDETESLTQPRYAPDGRLHFISDRSGWWNLYVDDENGGTPIAAAEEEFAGPDWVFGLSTYDFAADGSIVAISSSGGLCHLSLLRSGTRIEISTPYTDLSRLSIREGGVVALGGSARLPTSVVSIEVPSGETTVLRSARSASADEAYFSDAEPIEFPTEGGLTAHGLFYAPSNPDFVAPNGELAPLIVSSHGGPTSSSSSSLDYGIQYWTSRGIGVVQVNYGGSTGYGREYRERLIDNWGIVDLDDCVNAAKYLAASGRAEPARLLIHGGSAGGYTTLCALTFRDVFAAGASYFGVADAGGLAADTHKFESRYTDGLIGPWPEAEEVYRARSPVFHTDQLRTPLILFQGLEDKVVPPEQSEAMAQALRSKGVPFAYVAYEGEQHGFRRAENIKATVEAELYFYGRVLGFTPADELPAITIENAEALGSASEVVSQ